MSVTLPYTFTGGTTARAAEVNANFQAITAKFTEGAGGIKNEDISSSAAIDKTKLATAIGSRITEAQLEDDAVNARVLLDDATAGSPNAAVNNASHIKDRIITAAKIVLATITNAELAAGAALANLAAGSVAIDKLKITLNAVAFSTTLGTMGETDRVTAAPSSSFAKATYDLLGVYVKTLGGTAVGFNVAPFADDSGANWTGGVDIHKASNSGSTGTATGTLVYVFIAKT